MIASDLKLDDSPTIKASLPSMLLSCCKDLLKSSICRAVPQVRFGLADCASNGGALGAGGFLLQDVFYSDESRAKLIRTVRSIRSVELDHFRLETSDERRCKMDSHSTAKRDGLLAAGRRK